MFSSPAEDLDFGLAKVVINKTRAALPTAPRSARGPDVDLARVPCIPPFTAFLGNLPYDVTDEEIERFFRGMKVSLAGFLDLECHFCFNRIKSSFLCKNMF